MTAVLEAPRRARARAQAPARSRKVRPVAQATAATLTVQALQLLGRWQRVSTGHIALAAGCACGYGAAVDLREIDELILDFLHNRFIHAPPVTAFLRTHAYAAQGHDATRGSLTLLLRALAGRSAVLAPLYAGQLLQALDGSITSIEEQHR